MKPFKPQQHQLFDPRQTPPGKVPPEELAQVVRLLGELLLSVWDKPETQETSDE